MKKIIFTFLVLFIGSFISFSQSLFFVGQGQTKTLNPEQKEMLVDYWIMEDYSTIIVPTNFQNWMIHAKEATFGNNCKIIATGANGNNGAHASGEPRQADYCNNGAHGYNGAHAAPGSSGVDVSITVGLKSVTSLLISTTGGNGGNGGKGGKGGMGGAASGPCTCSGGHGGRGGNGGNGGNGGRAGNITFHYWISGASGIAMGNTGLQTIADGGTGGNPGAAGPGGNPGHGRRCGLIRRGSGNWGPVGSLGRKGANGAKGNVQFVALPGPK